MWAVMVLPSHMITRVWIHIWWKYCILSTVCHKFRIVSVLIFTCSQTVFWRILFVLNCFLEDYLWEDDKTCDINQASFRYVYTGKSGYCWIESLVLHTDISFVLSVCFLNHLYSKASINAVSTMIGQLSAIIFLSLFILKVAECSPENEICCVLFTPASFICAFWPSSRKQANCCLGRPMHYTIFSNLQTLQTELMLAMYALLLTYCFVISFRIAQCLPYICFLWHSGRSIRAFK